jgi:hypothetical protein
VKSEKAEFNGFRKKALPKPGRIPGSSAGCYIFSPGLPASITIQVEPRTLYSPDSTGSAADAQGYPWFPKIDLSSISRPWVGAHNSESRDLPRVDSCDSFSVIFNKSDAASGLCPLSRKTSSLDGIQRKAEMAAPNGCETQAPNLSGSPSAERAWPSSLSSRFFQK